jgi:hypothetical protein
LATEPIGMEEIGLEGMGDIGSGGGVGEVIGWKSLGKGTLCKSGGTLGKLVEHTVGKEVDAEGAGPNTKGAVQG